MALKYGFFNSVNGDRVYNADDMMYPYKGIVSNGVVADNKYSDGFQVVKKSGLQLSIKSGLGIFDSKWCELDSDMTINVPAPHVTLSRIDSVVIRVDKSTNARKISIEYLSSIPEENPSIPAITRSDLIKDYRLCNIRVAPNATEITQAEITDTRPSSECGFVTNLLQNSDISATYEQWHEQFMQWLAESENQFSNFVNRLDTEFDTFMTESTNHFLGNLNLLEETLNNRVNYYNAEFDMFMLNKNSEYNVFIDLAKDNYDEFIVEHERAITQEREEYENFVSTKQNEYETFVTNKQTEYETFVSTKENEYSEWVDAKKSEYNTFVSTEQANYENFVTEHETFIFEHEQAIAQEREEYETWTQEKQQAYDEWFSSLTDELLVKEAFLSYSSVYTATTDGETNIPINISSFSSGTDILTVYINGLKLIANVDYTLNGYQSITLTKGIDAGTVVAFDLLKTVVTTDVESVVNELQRIIKLIPTEATETNKLADKEYVDSVAGGGGGASQSQIDEINLRIDNLEDAILVANPAYTEMLWEQIQEGATETPISTPERIEEIWEAIGEGSGDGAIVNLDTNALNYTYVIDSDKKLNDWANNAAGNDYTSVLIRRGSWTATKGVNLTSTGTKVVVGEAGSKLVFTPTAGINCLAYSSTPNTSDYYMNGVYVEGVGVTVCFRNCANLTNCMGVGVTRGDGFIDCLNLTNCTAVAYGNVNGNAFNSCENLTNCKGTATGGNNGYGFQNCNNLTNCEGVGKGSYMPAGFRNCVSLTNCKGTGEGGTNGYGFQGCTLVSKCKAGGKSTIRVFETSYASRAKTSEYACADTPAGGFNDLTNPTA